ncbi:MAG: hypothetical protein AABY14_00540 [Nanoarchaeota archaeon]
MLFSGRELYLEQLQKTLSLLKKSEQKNIAIFGKNGVGKTYIVKEFLRRIDDKSILPIYIDLNRISLSPENLSIELIAAVSAWFFGYDNKWHSETKTLEGIRALKQILKNGSSEIIDKVVNELEKIKPNQQLLIEQAFNFSQAIAEENNKKIVFCIENFDKILELNGFEQVADVFSSINLHQKNILYITTSSAIEQFKPRLSKYNFEFINISPLSKEETKTLIEKSIGKVSSDIVNEIYSLTLGHPNYVSNVAKRFKETSNVKRAFLLEVLSKSGGIYRDCESTLQLSLARARGKTLLNVILNVLSHYDKLRLTEIARKIFRSAGVTKSLLTRLIEVDIISKSDNLYSIPDPVLRYFISHQNSGILSEPDESLLKKLEAEL